MRSLASKLIRGLWPLVLSACAAGAAPQDPLSWPATTRETRPWTRWWWLGNIGTPADFTAEMEKYAAAGLGGLEITPIYGVRGEEDKFVPFLSDAFADKLKHVIEEGRRLDLGIDMSTGTGWPFGGPWVDDDTSARYLAERTFTVEAGQRVGEAVTYSQKPVIHYAGPVHTPLSQLHDPAASNPNMQELALDQVRFEKPIPLVSLMAYPSEGAGDPVDLTSKVGADGHLDWVAPAAGAPWTLYGLFMGWHGKMVERAAPGGEGPAIDHFSSAALKRYLARFDEAFSKGQDKGMRAYFNDSYEVDDAAGESDFTGDFLEQFRERRGYDLRRELPALYGADATTERGARVLGDYRETVSDMLLDEFTKPWRAWAARRGALVRDQAHGSPANILDLYAAADIPETEGADRLHFKFASSVAHVMGKPLATAEAFTWLDEHFCSTLAEMKGSADNYFLGGIDGLYYHGTPFSPPGEPWPGFNFYASVEISTVNPLWTNLSAFNAYVTRVQSVMQASQPDEDVLLYYNIHDRWAERGKGSMPHFYGPEGTSSQETGESLLRAGYGFDFVSDRQLDGTQATPEHDGVRTPGGTHYRAVLVPPTKFMPLETFQHLVDMAQAGGVVLFEGGLPADVPGWGKLDARRAALRKLVQDHIPLGDADAQGVRAASVGLGRILAGADAGALLARAGIDAEPIKALGLDYIRRREGPGSRRVYLLANRGKEAFAGWVPLYEAAPSAAILDPLTGDTGLAQVRETAAGRSEAWLQLPIGGTLLVRTLDLPTSGRQFAFWRDAAGSAVALDGPWALAFSDGGPTLPAATTMARTGSWTELPGDAVKSFSGTGTYTLHVKRPAGDAPAWAIDLGRVAESARVTLNGQDLGVRFCAPYRWVVPAPALTDDNVIEVAVSNLAANRIADLDRHGVPWKRFYNTNMPSHSRENSGPDHLFSAAEWAPRPSGLLGPVRLVPLDLVRP